MFAGLLVMAVTAIHGGSRPLTSAERSGIESSVRAQLNDPDSATFRHNPFRTGEKIYCGRVNAKNRFGGYVGYRIFIVNVRGGKQGAMREEGEYGEASVLTTDNQFDGDSTKRLLFMITEAKCSASGYVTGYTPVKTQ